MEKSEKYRRVTFDGNLLVPIGLVGKLTELVTQCAQVDYVYRENGAGALYAARAQLSISISSCDQVRLDTLTIRADVYGAYKAALKTTKGYDVIGVEEWSKLYDPKTD